MIILTLIMMFLSLVFFVINSRGKEGVLLSGLFIGFITANIGLMFYYAKMGGLIHNERTFFFLTVQIEEYIRQSIITINDIARFLTWGRAIFLSFVILFALYISGVLQKRLWVGIIVIILPIYHSIITDPSIIGKLSYTEREFWFKTGDIYIVLYSAFAIVLMLKDYFDRNIRWVKQQLRYIILFVINLIIYFLFFLQVNPLSMMYYSKYTIFDIGFKVFRLRFSIAAWYFLIILFVFFIIVGLFALFRYARVNAAENKDNIYLERQMSTANLGTQVFIHGIKNQLLSSKIILRRMKQMLETSKLDTDEINNYIKELSTINENMTSRIEKLYQMFRHNTMSLKPCHISEVVSLALQKLDNIKSTIQLDITTEKDALILADKPYLSEAIYNILNNAISAIKSSPRADCGIINITLKAEHRWCAIRIEDNGTGIKKANIKKIFEPFYTDKNSNQNWGIGLSYVKQITKMHFGKIYLESKEDIGTVFILAFPIYRSPKPKMDILKKLFSKFRSKK